MSAVKMSSTGELSSSQNQMIEEFSGVTGAERDRARFYLESAAWNLQVALGSFYEDDSDVPEELSPTSLPAPLDPPPPVNPTPTRPSGPTGRAPTRFATLSSIGGNSSSDEEEGQAFYAGGSERSGQQVIGPGKKKKDIVSEMFKAAKEHGAEVVETEKKADAKLSAFRGTGYRLGACESDSSVVASSSAHANPGGTGSFQMGEPVEITLKLWKNGFSVDENGLRHYDDPANEAFLAAIKKGEIPQELVRATRGGEVSLSMEDHRQEEFRTPRGRVSAFSGAGHLLGRQAGDTPAPVAVFDSTPNNVEVRHVEVDAAQPVTTLQIRLVDGSRLTVKMNHSHTIADLYNYVIASRPSYSSTPFVLMTTFPNKELQDKTATLKDASLLNAVIVQRLK